MRQAACVALAVLCVVRLGAQGISLNCTEASFADVAKLLQQAGGVTITGAGQAPADTPKITLNLENASLRQALREVCRQAGWHYTRFGPGYHLLPGAQDERFTCHVGDYDVTLQRLMRQRSLVLDLTRGEPHTSLTNLLNIELIAESDDDEKLIALAGFDQQALAVTDTGVELQPDQRFGGYSGRSVEPVVRAWLNLPPPPEDAKVLARLEGDLVLFAKVERAEVELGLEEVGVTKQANGVSVTLNSFDRAGGSARLRLVMPLSQEAQPRRGLSQSQPQIRVTLADAAGKTALQSGHSSSGGNDGKTMTYDYQASFRLDADFLPVRLTCRVAVPYDPSDRLTYLFENIPLPVAEEAKAPLDELP
jgi:hypothetical protein